MINEENYGNENMDEEPVIVPLELDSGAVVNCHVIAIFDCEGINYIALLPEETTEILMFRYIELENDEIQIINIDSELEWERVVQYFDNMLEEEE